MSNMSLFLEKENILKRKLKRRIDLLRLYDGVHFFTRVLKRCVSLERGTLRLEGGQHV